MNEVPETVERVARAIAALRSCSLEWGPKQPICASCSNARGYSDDVGCVTLARAAIAAMREPTEAMQKAGFFADTSENYHAGI
jgi:hypothetical protein